MNTYVQPKRPVEHQGVARLERAAHFLGHIGRHIGRARNLVVLLLAGALSALVVVADQIVSTWNDGPLLLAWVALWSALFAALALSAEVAFGWYTRFQTIWNARRAAAAAAAAHPRRVAEL